MSTNFNDLPFEIHKQVADFVVSSVNNDDNIDDDNAFLDPADDVSLSDYALINRTWLAIMQDHLFAEIRVSDYDDSLHCLVELLKRTPSIRRLIKRLIFEFSYDDASPETNGSFPAHLMQLWNFLSNAPEHVAGIGKHKIKLQLSPKPIEAPKTAVSKFDEPMTWATDGIPSNRVKKKPPLHFHLPEIPNLPSSAEVISFSCGALRLSSRQLLSPGFVTTMVQSFTYLERLHVDLYYIPRDVKARKTYYPELIAAMNFWPKTITHLHLTHSQVESTAFRSHPETTVSVFGWGPFNRAVRKISKQLKVFKLEGFHIRSALFEAPREGEKEESDEWPMVEEFDVRYQPDDAYVQLYLEGFDFVEGRWSQVPPVEGVVPVEPVVEHLSEIYRTASLAMLKMPKIKFFRLWDEHKVLRFEFHENHNNGPPCLIISRNYIPEREVVQRWINRWNPCRVKLTGMPSLGSSRVLRRGLSTVGPCSPLGTVDYSRLTL